jgi:hypothetical protein
MQRRGVGIDACSAAIRAVAGTRRFARSVVAHLARRATVFAGSAAFWIARHVHTSAVALGEIGQANRAASTVAAACNTVVLRGARSPAPAAVLDVVGEVHANIAAGFVRARADELAFAELTHGVAMPRRRADRAAAATVARIRVEIDAGAATDGLTFATPADALRRLCLQVAQVSGQALARRRAEFAVETRRNFRRTSEHEHEQR